jgi:aminoglycoside phosphotransferase
MNIVLVAGGLGSRLAPLTNCIPKFLVNIGKQTGYVQQIRYWLQYCAFQKINATDTITVIVHSAYKDLVLAYHELYFPDVLLIVKTVDEANGSAHAIMSTCSHLVNKDVFFQWCDVLPANIFTDSDFTNRYNGDNVIFTNYDHPNRYGVSYINRASAHVLPKLQSDGRGGIFGMYYIPKFKVFNVHYNDGQDFVEIIEQFGKIQECEIGSIIDFGDMPKLQETRSTADAAREFNKIEFHGDMVLKSALNVQGEQLIKREINWYNEVHSKIPDLKLPSTWVHSDSKSFVMSKVHGVPVFQQWGKLDSESRVLVLSRILDQMKLMHSAEVKISNDIVMRDLKIEACDKLLKRYREIKPVIDSFGNITKVNGFKLRELDPEVTIRKLFAKLVHRYACTSEYSIIHGDLQMSNTMIDPGTLEVSIIDPRGYFGETEVLGLPDYDVAKLLYSLSGYDLFNYSSTFNISKSVSSPDYVLEVNFEIPKPDITGCEAIINSTFYEDHYIWLAIIWIGLAAYIKNDPVKSLAAHYHGLAMAEKVLADINDKFAP